MNMENKHKLIISHANCKRPRSAKTKMTAVWGMSIIVTNKNKGLYNVYVVVKN